MERGEPGELRQGHVRIAVFPGGAGLLRKVAEETTVGGASERRGKIRPPSQGARARSAALRDPSDPVGPIRRPARHRPPLSRLGRWNAVDSWRNRTRHLDMHSPFNDCAERLAPVSEPSQPHDAATGCDASRSLNALSAVAVLAFTSAPFQEIRLRFSGIYDMCFNAALRKYNAPSAICKETDPSLFQCAAAPVSCT